MFEHKGIFLLHVTVYLTLIKNFLANIGRVNELLINSEKASTPPVFGENVERFLCLRFSITHTHDPNIVYVYI